MGDGAFGTLSGVRAVVTGSSSGIGRAIALEFARGGAHLVVHCRSSRHDVELLAAEIKKMGGKASALQADLADEGGLVHFAEAAWKCYGGVDVWVNNAGVDLLTGEKSKLDFSRKLQLLHDVDIRSTLLLSRWVGSRMAKAGTGVILNIGWDQAERGMEGDSGELFAAAKGAVMDFTRSLALSLAPAVRVNCIAPGWIRTAWGRQAGDRWQERVIRETPLGRWGTPEDVAKVARFLASREASFITGQVINVNGGAIR